MKALRERIASRAAHVVVVGAGYVGLPLAVESAKAGFRTVAYDKVATKVQAIMAGRSYISDIRDEVLGPLVKAGTLSASDDPEVLRDADAIIICVPTPLNKTKDPDNSFILDAADLILPRLRGQQLVVLESTTFPGFSREVLLPRLESTGRIAGQDFFLAFSPERVDPGNKRFQTRNTPKVIGATDRDGLDCAVALYQQIVETLVPVSSTDTAEMVKLLENTFRSVNIGLVNEVAIMCEHLGLDTWEVIEAAATKPFGFMPFFPGPGLGGHCIPIDPLFLSWKLKTLKYQARFIELADQVNSAMPGFVVGRVAEALNEHGKPVKGSRILICGVAYKKDIDDVRESPALDIMELLQRRGAELSFHDPHVLSLGHASRAFRSEIARVELDRVADFDCVVITTDHSGIDYGKLVVQARLIVDTRNATRGIRQDHRDKVFCL